MHIFKKSKNYLWSLFVCMSFFSCSNIGFELPQGPQGVAGQSAYEVWKEEVKSGHIDWPSEKVEVADFLFYIKGQKGDKGNNGLSAYEQWKELIAEGNVPNPHVPGQMWPSSQNTESDFWNFLSGKDGESPYIGPNGNWWINHTDTGVRSTGKDGLDGKDGASAYELWKQLVAAGEINWPKDQVTQNDFFLSLKGKNGNDGITPHVGSNGHWYVGSTDTGVSAKGEAGLSPYIGNNGNWWVGTTDTGVAPKGADGLSPHIGNNGNWWIGNSDTNVQAMGQNGSNGISAYELWKKDVESGKVTGKNGEKWPVGKNTVEDFYDYLRGSDGNDGKSVYILWKETVIAGKVRDPNNPEQVWPTDKVSENDFFSYLAGKDGKDGNNGVNGLSAYELWKNDLARRCNTPEALTDHREGGTWDCEKNTLDDFYNYLRGKDGEDGEKGKDGKPGEPGRPGLEVTIIQGVPNVIAQYSQSEFGEYVRTTDGGVLYKVYDEQGQSAPHAVVKGMPGINPEKVYTANDQGEFIVPKEDLPEIQDVDLRWGVVKSVTIEGKVAKASAKNTYVPNRVHLRVVLDASSLDSQQNLYYYVQRKMNPDDEWQNIPSYLPNSASRYMDSYRVSDKNDPKSILTDQKLVSSSNSSSSSNGSYRYYNYTNRPLKENLVEYKNGYPQYWDGTDVYYTLKGRTTYYGEEYQWNGVCLLAPYQLGPVLKKLKLKSLNNGDVPAFASAEGELDFSKVDFTKIYQSSCNHEVKENGMDYVEPIVYSEEAARKLEIAYVKFRYNSSAGTQEASSSNNRSSDKVPTFKVFTPFLNSTVSIENVSSCYFYAFTQGYLQRGTEPNTFIVKQYSNNFKIDEVEVTYEE